MLSHEWHELETLCNRISTLRHRLVAAQRSNNAGFVESLKIEIVRGKRQREALVQHISARLGLVTAHRAHSGSPAQSHH